VSLASVSLRKRQLFGTLGTATFLLILSMFDVLTRGAISLPSLVPPFGASVVIVFFTPESVTGRPRNVIVGHLSCALAASAVLWLLPHAPLGLLAALAVSAGGLLMLATRSFHPPGGATALLAVMAERRLGLSMALCPALVGAVTLVGTRVCLDSLIARFSAKRSAC
jgi:CBS-domain-containing membrane protein